MLAAALLACGGTGRAETYGGWCAARFSAAQIAAGLAAPSRDADSDGCANVIEYLGGTDPLDAGSRVVLRPAGSPQARTVVFPMATDREDVVHEVAVSSDLLTWSARAVQLCAGPEAEWWLDGHPFVRVGVKRRVGHILDSDLDGLDDFFEEALAASDPHDGFAHLGDIHPDDDFDKDGIPNLAEEGNAPEPLPGGAHTPPAAIGQALLNCALDDGPGLPAPAPAVLVVHTPLR